MPQPQVQIATTLNGTEWQLMVQGGKLTRAQITSIIAFARTGYTTDNLPEGSTRLYYTDARVMAAVASALATKATPADITTAINSLVNAAPGTLDTLKEIADAIGDDPNFATTMSAALAQRLRVDIAQSLTTTQQGQGRTNLGLGTAATKAITDFAAAIHTHAISDVTNLQSSLDSKVNVPATPTSRTIAFGTAYQATTPAKTALISVMVETVYTVTVASTLADTVELRIGSDATGVAAGTNGTAIATFRTSLTGIALTVGMANTQRNQLAALIPPNWYFAVRRVAGTTATIQGAFDQSL